MLDWLSWLVHALTAAAAIAFMVARRRGRIPARWTVAETLIGTACAAALLALTSGPVLIDFTKAYHYAGQAILTDPAALYACARAQCYVNLPIVALLFTPLAPLPPSAAGAIFSIAGAVALAFALRRMAGGTPADVVLWLALLNGPLYYSIRIGNTTHFLLIVLLIAFERLARGRDRLAGVLLAAASLIKPPLAIFLIYLLVRRRFRAALSMAGAAAAVVALSVALYGVALHLFWLREFVVGHGAAPVAAYNVQSVNGFLAHLMTRGYLRDWYPIQLGAGFRAASLLLTLAIVAAAGAVCGRAGPPASPQAWRVELWIVLTLSLLVAPISWTHYYALLLVPIAALLAARTEPIDRRGLIGLLLAAALISPPVVILPVSGRVASALYARVAISHYFYGGVVLLAVLLAVRRRETAASAVTWRPVAATAPPPG